MWRRRDKKRRRRMRRRRRRRRKVRRSTHFLTKTGFSLGPSSPSESLYSSYSEDWETQHVIIT